MNKSIQVLGGIVIGVSRRPAARCKAGGALSRGRSPQHPPIGAHSGSSDSGAREQCFLRERGGVRRSADESSRRLVNSWMDRVLRARLLPSGDAQ